MKAKTKSKPTLPNGLEPEHFTAAEITQIGKLLQIYASKLSATGDITSRQTTTFNRTGLFELGINTPCPLMSKLLVHYKNNTIAENIIIAHGYNQFTGNKE